MSLSLFNIYRSSRDLNKNLKKIAKLNISHYMSETTDFTVDRYIINHLSNQVKIIIFGKDIYVYFYEKNQKYIRRVLYDNYKISLNYNEKILNPNTQSILKKSNYNHLQELFKKISLKKVINYLIYRLFVKFFLRNSKRFKHYFDRIIFPYFFLGTTFKSNEFEKDIQNRDNFDFLIVFDKYYELVFKKIFSNKKIFFTKHPAYNSCFCNKINI